MTNLAYAFADTKIQSVLVKMSAADGFKEVTQEQRDLYGDDNFEQRSVFRNTQIGSLRLVF